MEKITEGLRTKERDFPDKKSGKVHHHCEQQNARKGKESMIEIDHTIESFIHQYIERM